MMARVGVTLSFGHAGTPFTRVPFGISIGHRIGLNGGMSLTPYVTPQASLDFCGSGHCIAQVRGGSAQSGLGASFGVGANFQFTRDFAARAEVAFNRSTLANLDNTIGIGVAWQPPGLRGP